MGLLKFNFMRNIRKQVNGLRELNPYDLPTKVKKNTKTKLLSAFSCTLRKSLLLTLNMELCLHSKLRTSLIQTILEAFILLITD